MKRIEGFSGQYRFLSNFFPLQFGHIGLYSENFKTSEHLYQSEKFRGVDVRKWEEIIYCESPGKAKKLAAKYIAEGCSVRENFHEKRTQIMGYALSKKFDLNNRIGSNLAVLLLATGDTEIVELNTWGDTFWGMVVGSSGESTGNNFVGRLLMSRRDTLWWEFREMCHAKWLSTPAFSRGSLVNFVEKEFEPIFLAASEELGIDIPNDFKGEKSYDQR